MHAAIVLPTGFRFDLTQPNSIETVVRTLAQHSRHRVTVLADAGARDHGPFEVIELDTSVGRWKRTERAIGLLHDLKPDFLELHQHAPTARRIARAFPEVPSAWYRHNFLKAPKNWFQRWRHTRRNRDFDGHIFVSEATRDAFAEAFPVFADRAHAIPNGIDPAPWLGEVEDKQKLIAYAGRAAPEKGFAELCSALVTVLEAHPDWSVGICANAWDTHGDWAEQQVSPLRRFGARFQVQVNQPIGSVRDLLKRATIAAVPSQYFEAFGLAAIEAHVAGCAVLSSGIGGLREASGEHALYVDPITAETVASGLTRLIEDVEFRLALARSGQAFAIAEHDAPKRAAELDDLRERIREAKQTLPDLDRLI
ncbi:MAG: glycosyltransferase family 4 protein [Pseudomonadota bacterium]